MKICYGMLNYERPASVYSEVMSHVPTEDVIFAASYPEAVTEEYPNVKVIDINNTSVATSKNRLLEYAHENKYDYLFIIEDDAVIHDITIFDDYISLMKTFGLGYINYGCGRETNVIFGVPNPALILSGTKNSKSYTFNRMPYSMITGYDLKMNKLYYDETYEMIETKEYMIRLVKHKIIPFMGFYIDIENASTRVTHFDNKRVRSSDVQRLLKEQSIFNAAGKKYVAEDKIENVLEWANTKV